MSPRADDPPVPSVLAQFSPSQMARPPGLPDSTSLGPDGHPRERVGPNQETQASRYGAPAHVAGREDEHVTVRGGVHGTSETFPGTRRRSCRGTSGRRLVGGEALERFPFRRPGTGSYRPTVDDDPRTSTTTAAAASSSPSQRVRRRGAGRSNGEGGAHGGWDGARCIVRRQSGADAPLR